MAYSVLIIDDDRVFCEELSEVLEEFHTLIALSPQQAVDILSAPNTIDLALLDVRLPGMWGTELLKIVKKRHPEVIIIIMTAFASKEVIVGALRNQADDFFEKPINVTLLLSRIRELLLSKNGMPETSSNIEFLEHYLRKNDDKKVEIEDLAQLMGYTPKYMSRLFKQKMGINFVEYRLKQKLNKAKELLLSTDWPIKQIAYHLTYENPESFVRIFKKRTGLTPSQYRKNS